MTSNKAELEFELLRFGRWQKIGYRIGYFFRMIPIRLWHVLCAIGRFLKMVGIKTGGYFRDLVMTFVNGTWKTRTSYAVMGISHFTHKQYLRGVLFLGFELAFIFYMIFAGGNWLSQIGTLGTQGAETVKDPTTGFPKTIYHDNSFKILLYSVLTIFFIVALIYTWSLNVKQARIHQELEEDGKHIRDDKDNLRALVDRDFHRTLLALPTVGIIVFTVIPIIFMILVAFTNYDAYHQPPGKLFTWVGWDNFNELFNFGGGASSFAATFGEILVWTLIWAFFATFTNYFFGMLVALLINKKGIKFKKGWRTILVLTITIPQFISLLYISKMFGENGIVNKALMDWGWISKPLPFWTDAGWARVTVIIINIWIGVPYLMLMVTGILMNIPADLYESAKIDGASPMQQYFKITLPYMLFVTGPYLLTSFTGNMNNFNVIYLLTGGGPTNNEHFNAAGDTNLLITWLYSTTVNQSNYALASVIGIMVFIIVGLITVIVYNILPSNKNEDDLA